MDKVFNPSMFHMMRAGPRGASASRCMSGRPAAMCVGMSKAQSERIEGSVTGADVRPFLA